MMQVHKEKNISSCLSIWWTKLSKVEQSALLTMAGIIGSIQLFTIGIFIGRLIF